MLIWYLSRKYQPYCQYQFCKVEARKINYAIAVRELRRDEQLQDLEPLLSFFASFVLDIPLHRHCHDKKTASDGSLVGIHDKNHIIEEPYEAKVSRTVL